jgi:hypothetical protein
MKTVVLKAIKLKLERVTGARKRDISRKIVRNSRHARTMVDDMQMVNN